MWPDTGDTKISIFSSNWVREFFVFFFFLCLTITDVCHYHSCYPGFISNPSRHHCMANGSLETLIWCNGLYCIRNATFTIYRAWANSQRNLCVYTAGCVHTQTHTCYPLKFLFAQLCFPGISQLWLFVYLCEEHACVCRNCNIAKMCYMYKLSNVGPSILEYRV